MTPTPHLPPEDADVALTRLAQFIGRAVGVPGDLDALADLSKLKEALQEAERERDGASREAAGFRAEAEEQQMRWLEAHDRAVAAEAREAALAARLRALGYNVTAILESDLLATDPGATE